MNPDIGAGEGNLHHQRLLRRILVFPLGIVYRLCTLSVRMHYTEERGLRSTGVRLPVVITLAQPPFPCG